MFAFNFKLRRYTKESQNRYSRVAKDWGWREFVTLTTLFDQAGASQISRASQMAVAIFWNMDSRIARLYIVC